MIAPREIIARARALHKTQVAWRRELHAHPELSDQEFGTTAFLRKKLKGLGCRILRIDLPTGVLAELAGSAQGPTVAIRSDIDALPVLEQTGLPFKSKQPGVMHACGHDMHMATVLGAATVLSDLRKSLPGKVRFIFQPSEEMPPGGARPMIANGAVEGVSQIFGLHVDPHVPTGKIGLRDGATMAAVLDFDLVIKGKGGHAARPHDAVDAIVTASEVVQSIQAIVSREFDPMEPVVITFGQMVGGTARNVIADEVRLVGTARTLSESAYKKLPTAIKRTAQAVCRARGAVCEMKVIAGYPVLRNDAATNRLYRESYGGLFGSGQVVTTEAVLGGEDFACYVEKVPGAMFRLGIMNKRLKADQPWHSPRFMADEQALVYGTSLLVSATLNFLDRPGR